MVLFLAGPSSKYNFQTRLSQFVKYSFMTHATFILLEHRFYGESLPEGNGGPFSAANLLYLTVDQALADVAEFVDYFQAAFMPEGTPWFVTGDAYSASLAAWFTQSYHHPLIVGTIASSAALEARVDFHEYFAHFRPAAEQVAGLGNGGADGVATTAMGSDCADQLRDGTRAIAQLLADGGDEGRAAVASLFGACEGTVAPADEFFFKWAVSEVIASALELNTAPVWSLNRTCAAALLLDGFVDDGSGGASIENISSNITSSMVAVQRAFRFNMDFSYKLCLEDCEGRTDMQRVAEVLFRPPQRSRSDDDAATTECTSFDQAAWLASLRTNASNPDRAWWWQRCTELGWFHGTPTDGAATVAPTASVFFEGLDVQRVVAYCAEIFEVGVPRRRACARACGGAGAGV